jgi:tetratricopeptide (TPR) repeat protein
MPQQVKKSLVISIYLVLTVSALLVFWQVRNFDFVNYDDNKYVSENHHVLNGLTADNVIWAFTTGFAEFWHPLTWLSLMLDCQLFGPNPGAMHLVNLLLHIANTLLLFIVLKKMTGALWQSAFVAAMFALHPLHVESVAWIAERKDVLSTFFWLLAMLAYAQYVKKPGVARYLLTLLVFALGLMAKPMLVTLPFVLLLLDYWPLDRISRFQWKIFYRLVLEKIPFIVISIASCVITFLVQQSGRVVISFDRFPLKFRISNVFISYVRYMEKLFYPGGLAAFYPHPLENVSVLYAVISAILLLAVTILVLRFAQNHRYLVTGWFWYLGTLIPVIGIVQVGSQAYADRYTYITLTGLFIIIAWGLPELLKKLLSASPVESPQRKIALGLSMILALATLGICAHRQTSYWKNSVTLFSHALSVTQNNYVAYDGLGAAYVSLGRIAEAIDDYKQAVQIKPNYADAYSDLGVVYSGLGRWTEAMDAYKQAIRIRPDYADYYLALGNTYNKLGRYQDSVKVCKQAIRIKPDYAEAYNNLGVAYARLERWPEAIEACKQAIKINPDYTEAYNNLGITYSRLDRLTEAIDAYKQAVKIKPDLAEAYYNLGRAYVKLGRGIEAIDAYKQAIKIRPDLAEAHNNLGRMFANNDRWPEAIDAYKQAIKIKPDLAEAYYNLGLAYLAIGDKNSALAQYNILKSMNSQFADNLFREINK